MTRTQLEHLLRAASTITEDDQILVIGSQAILGQFPDAPQSLLVSIEADFAPLQHPERWDLIDGTIGEGSPFHETFGYYAQGVGEETAVLPEGWRERLVAIRGPGTRGATGWALEVHDLLVSKLAAGREKDFSFAREVLRHGLADPELLLDRLATTDIPAEKRAVIRGIIRQHVADTR